MTSAERNNLKLRQKNTWRANAQPVRRGPIATPVTPVGHANALLEYPGVGSVIQASRRSRPYWFDGRFLAASDMERDQQFFLRRQKDLGRAAGGGVIHGLMVEPSVTGNQPADAETVILRAGHGLTSGGDAVMLPADLTLRLSDLADEENLDVQFGLAATPAPIARTRSGLFVLALRPVEFTANPITAYPTSLQGSTGTHDGDVVEASAVSLVPFALPASDSASRRAAAARQIFVEGQSVASSESLLPLAMISIERGAIEWIDPYLVRRESAPAFAGLRFGLPGPAAQQAFLMHYDAQLLAASAALAAKNQPVRFAATDYFQALPPAGRFPIAALDPNALTQNFFPPGTDVTLALVAEDELPAILEESLSLPPIDLTQPASAYADLAVFLLVPVSRDNYANLSPNLQPTALTASVPHAVVPRGAASLLRFYQAKQPAVMTRGAGWGAATQGLTWGYYVRRRSLPIFALPDTATTTTTLTSEGSDVAGVTLTATVSPSAATGTVSFNEGATVLGTATLNGGVASLVLPEQAAGEHSYTAAYPGDANHGASTSGALSLRLTGD